MVGKFFPENPSTYEIMSTTEMETEYKWRHSMAHTRCMLNKQGYTDASECTRPRSWAPTRTRAGMRVHKYVILIAFAWQKWFPERASILRYTYIAYLVDVSGNLTNGLRIKSTVKWSVTGDSLLHERALLKVTTELAHFILDILFSSVV